MPTMLFTWHVKGIFKSIPNYSATEVYYDVAVQHISNYDMETSAAYEKKESDHFQVVGYLLVTMVGI